MRSLFISMGVAVTFLTRIPLFKYYTRPISDKEILNSQIFFPLIGLFYGTLHLLLALMLQKLNLPVEIIISLVLLLSYSLNGFLHFDGLCDVLDAFLADKSPAKRLDILKDSTIGSFACGGAVLLLLIRFFGMKELFIQEESQFYFLLIPVFSRFSISLLSTIGSYARKNGTGKIIISESTWRTATLALLFTLTISSLFIVWIDINSIIPLVALLCTTIIFTIMMNFVSHKKIKGITGDVLGANSEVHDALLPLVLLMIHT